MSSQISIDPDLMGKLAKLAKLSFSSTELENLTQEAIQFLKIIEPLSSFQPKSEDKPLYSLSESLNPLRQDESVQSDRLALLNSSQGARESQFEVPQVL